MTKATQVTELTTQELKRRLYHTHIMTIDFMTHEGQTIMKEQSEHMILEIDKCSKDQRDLIMVFWSLCKPFAANGEIYSEYRKYHPCDADPVKHRENRIRNVLQRNCETSKQFKDGDGRKIFGTQKRGFWGLTPEYLAAVSSSSP